MFRTIFRKLMVVYVAVLLFSFSIAGLMLYQFLGNFVSARKVEALNQSAEQINAALTAFVENQNNPLVRLLFDRLLVSHSVSTESIIWIVDMNGFIILDSGTPDIIKTNLKIESGVFRLPDEQQYKEVMTGLVGKNDYIQKMGDFYGLFSGTGDSWLTIEKPFRYKGSDGKEAIIGAVFLNTRLPGIYQARSSIFKMFMLAVLISVVIATVLVYIFSLRITRPLKEIKNAAKIIASGEFQKRLDIRSNDEIGELAASFNHMAVALQNLEEMRRGFIANVSHELRTPMTSIRGFIEGILDGTVPAERQRDYLGIVKDEAIRLNRLVNDLLDLAKMEAGELTLLYKEFDINELIRRCIIKLESLIVQKNLQLEASFEEEDMLVSADPDAIERVIINLVHNAVKFTPEGGKIGLSTQRQKDRVLVSVEDNGIGISKEELDLIWERFYKSDKSRGNDKTGTGLGLAIVKNIINEHRQDIRVESDAGKGTKFTFTLERV